MTEEKTAFQLLEEKVEAKRLELSVTYKTTVHAYIVNVSSDFPEDPYAIAYIKEPVRFVKTQAIDAMDQSVSMAGDIILKHGLLPESDHRILLEDTKYDTLYLTMIRHARGLLMYYADVIKKN